MLSSLVALSQLTSAAGTVRDIRTGDTDLYIGYDTGHLTMQKDKVPDLSVDVATAG